MATNSFWAWAVVESITVQCGGKLARLYLKAQCATMLLHNLCPECGKSVRQTQSPYCAECTDIVIARQQRRNAVYAPSFAYATIKRKNNTIEAYTERGAWRLIVTPQMLQPFQPNFSGHWRARTLSDLLRTDCVQLLENNRSKLKKIAVPPKNA